MSSVGSVSSLVKMFLSLKTLGNLYPCVNSGASLTNPADSRVETGGEEE